MSAYDQWLTQAAFTREAAGLNRQLSTRQLPQHSADLIDLAGNDYLGLSRHPQVIAGAIDATRTYGAGAGASRLVTGTLAIHTKLEHDLAAFVGAPTALVFSTGYHANISVVGALVDTDTLVVSDAHIHASMIDGTRMSRAQVAVAAHNEVDTVRALLRARTQRKALVLTESVFSVLGDAAPLDALAAVCHQEDALLVVDDAHALGVCGPGGSGLAAHLATDERVVITATLSKALGAQGGVVLASEAIRDHLINHARPFIYDTGLAPGAAGAAYAALELIRDDPTRCRRALEVAAALAEASGVDVPAGAVLAVPMESPQVAVEAVTIAAEQGLRIGCFRPPSTPDGISRLRLTAHANLSDSELDQATRVIRQLCRGTS